MDRVRTGREAGQNMRHQRHPNTVGIGFYRGRASNAGASFKPCWDPTRRPGYLHVMKPCMHAHLPHQHSKGVDIHGLGHTAVSQCLWGHVCDGAVAVGHNVALLHQGPCEAKVSHLQKEHACVCMCVCARVWQEWWMVEWWVFTGNGGEGVA